MSNKSHYGYLVNKINFSSQLIDSIVEINISLIAKVEEVKEDEVIWEMLKMKHK